MIHIDMDGLVADFENGIRRLYGKDFESLSRSEQDTFWNSDCPAHRFFANLEPIPERIALVNGLIKAGVRFTFMTSTGGGKMHLNIAKQKLDFLSSLGLAEYPVAFCLNTASKAWFASKDAILIDDRQKVVDAWEKAGGMAYLFTRDNWESLLNMLLQCCNDDSMR
ncbi:hypothetical protein SH449x_004110 [Pirellulaceae bacterium SH449]